jgi:hypothetical protein
MPRRERPTNTTVYQPTPEAIAQDAERVLSGRRPRYNVNNHLVSPIIRQIVIPFENDEPVNYNIEIDDECNDPIDYTKERKKILRELRDIILNK